MTKKIVTATFLIFLISSAIFPITINADYKINQISYDMIIIAPSYFSQNLEPLISHKNNLGLKTIFISIDDIYNEVYFPVKGRDDPEKIKYFIKDSIETWNITYVLLVGGAEQVPVRYSHTYDNYSAHPEWTFISDLYYADIYDSSMQFSSWDKNENGLFAEWIGEYSEDGPINLIPDVCLGRLACIDESEVKITVKKIIDYESKIADDSWFKKMVVVGGDTYSEFPGNEGEIYNQMALDEMQGFTPVKLWASTGTLRKRAWGIVKEMNKGCGFIYFSGHGNPRIWSTYSSEGSVGNLRLFNMLFLSNKDKLPVCIVEGCQNSKFDVSSQDDIWSIFFPWRKACWSWKLVNNPNGGSIATIGSTGLCWYSAEYDGAGSNWLSLQFFKEYNSGEKVIGKIWKECITKFISENPIDWNTPSGSDSCIDAKTVQEWILLGDPSLIIGGKTGK
jgi:hypothetical protein